MQTDEATAEGTYEFIQLPVALVVQADQQKSPPGLCMALLAMLNFGPTAQSISSIQILPDTQWSRLG